MTKKNELDINAAHSFFSCECFNKAWELIDKQNRTSEENETMIQLAFASCWHWNQRKDCTNTNRSTGYWQISRIYAILGQADNARRYAQLCLGISQGKDIPPFYLAYAYEALARAESLGGNREKMNEYLKEAQRLTDTVSNPDEKKLLIDDLATIK